MAINFPASPSLNDTYTFSGRTWVWNGSAWQLQTESSTTLNSLSDVAAPSPSDGQALVYNASSGKWIPGTASGGTGGGWVWND